MEPRPVDTAASSALCTSCGLCCTGVMFDIAPLDPDELGRATEQGLRPCLDQPGAAHFRFPCPRLEGTRCGIYADRPRVCRAFRCKLLEKVESGEVTGAEANSLIVEAKTMMEEVRPLVVESGGPITPKWWRNLYHDWSAKARAGGATPVQARLVLELARLNFFLDTHFRRENQRILNKRP